MTPLHAAVLGLAVAAPDAAPVEPEHRPLVRVTVGGDPPHDIQWVGFTTDGRHLAVRSAPARGRPGDEAVTLLDTATGRVVGAAPTAGNGGLRLRPPTCAVSPRGEWVAYGNGRAIHFLAVPPHQPVLPGGGKLPLPNNVITPAPTHLWAHPAGGLLAWDGSDIDYTLERIDFPDPATRTPMAVRDVLSHRPPNGYVYAVALDPRARWFAVAVNGGVPDRPVLHLWTLGATPARTVVAEKLGAWCLAAAPDGSFVAAGYPDSTVAWLDPVTGYRLGLVPLRARYSVTAVAVHPTGKYLAATTNDGKGQPNLFLIDITAGKVVGAVSVDPDAGVAVCFSPGGDKLAACGPNGVLTVWDANRLLHRGVG